MKTSLSSVNPTNYEILAEIEVSTPEEIKQKVQKAHDAKLAWKEMGLQKRVGLLRNVVEKIAEQKETLSELVTKEMGMPIMESLDDIDGALSFFNWYLDNAEKYLSPEIVFEDEEKIMTVYSEPFGVAAVITPWNFPLSNFVWGAGQNLIAGNTVVYKTSEETALFGKKLEEILLSAGLPDGVFSEVYGNGEVGNMLVNEDINLISFTGSTKVGQELYKIAGEKFIKAVCELGGSSPGIVLADADIDRVLDSIYLNRFCNCGQVCDALKRLIVHESKFEEVVEKLKNKLEALKIGDPLDKETELGPLVAKRQLELLEQQVEDAVDKGGHIITGGKRVDGLSGAFYMPTIITEVQPDMRVWSEEVFGPVLPIVSFKTEDEAIKLANDTIYGLGAYVFTEDKSKAKEIAAKIDAGMVEINNAGYVAPSSPFGGMKKSGMGREHGKFGFVDLTQIKVISTEK